MKKHLIFFGCSLLLLICGNNSIHAQFPSAINLDTIGDNGLMISRVAKVVPAIPVPPTSPILQPDTGWTGPIEQPEAIGDSSMLGYDAKAIARWDVVPYQTFDDKFHIGVVAFHMNGIDRVSFSVDGGPWVDVYEMQLNPRTNVEEYTVTLDANLFAQNGPVEVRAIAWPKGAGEPRVLDSLPASADPTGEILANRQIRWVSATGDNSTGDGSRENPFATIKQAAMSINQAQGGIADNGYIYLETGDYPMSGGWEGAPWSIPSTINSYLTISGAPDLPPEDVRITLGGSSERLQVKLLRFQNVLIETTVSSGPLPNGDEPHLWIDKAYWGDGYSHAGFPHKFFTNVRSHNAFQGIFNAKLVRNAILEDLYSDAFQNTQCVINATIDIIDRREHTGVHPDIIQWHWTSGNLDNLIYYNIHATNCKAQQFFLAGEKDPVAEGDSFSNIAVVNALFANSTSETTLSSQVALPGNHLLFWHTSFINGGGLLLTDKGSTITNISIRNSVFKQFIFSSAWTGIVDNNHFINNSVTGTQSTTGDPLWNNVNANDYSPASGSPLNNRNTIQLVPTDVLGNTFSGSIGAIQSEQ